MKVPKLILTMLKPKNTTTIHISNLKLNAIIGTNGWERKKKQRILVSLSFDYDGRLAGRLDQLNKAVDYHQVIERIEQSVNDSTFFLLERLATFLLEVVLQDKRVVSATIRIDKPEAIKTAESVAIILSARNSHHGKKYLK